MLSKNWLYSNSVQICDGIEIKIPSVREVLEHENEYYGMVTLLTAMPIDLMCQLDDMGIDFAQITEYELFLIMFPVLQQSDTSLIFGDLDLSKFQMAISDTNKVVLYNQETGMVIDRGVQQRISYVLRRIHGLKKNTKKPGNEEAKEFMLERARKKMKRRNNQISDSQLEPLIVSLVCTKEFKYDFESTKDLSIYQFNLCVKQVINKIEYDNRMVGVYTGNIDAKSLQNKDLTWLLQND